MTEAGTAAQPSPAATPAEHEQAELDASFEVFCRENFVAVHRFLRTLCADEDLVQEAAQEAFIAAHAKWAHLRGFEKPMGWMYKTARNKLMTQRTRRRRHATASLDEVPAGLLAAPATSQEARDLRDSWLRRLPPRQAEVFAMSEDGWTDREIAEILAIAYNTVRAYKQEARQRLERLAAEAGFRVGR
ncbi:RNA polymerase sigma factor [Actinomycetes bacterium KLBMP 9797]